VHLQLLRGRARFSATLEAIVLTSADDDKLLAALNVFKVSMTRILEAFPWQIPCRSSLVPAVLAIEYGQKARLCQYVHLVYAQPGCQLDDVVLRAGGCSIPLSTTFGKSGNKLGDLVQWPTKCTTAINWLVVVVLLSYASAERRWNTSSRRLCPRAWQLSVGSWLGCRQVGFGCCTARLSTAVAALSKLTEKGGSMSS
jgi:hypothetical protein